MSKRLLLIFLICGTLSIFILCGCRVRTTAVLPSGQSFAVQSGIGNTDTGPDGAGTAEFPLLNGDISDQPEDPAEGSEPEGKTREDPEALRKEFDENAAAEILERAERVIHSEGEGTGAPGWESEAERRASKLSDQAKESAEQIVPADEAENKGVSEDAEKAESLLQYYTVLLQDRVDRLYECQRAYVYWETIRDHVTIFKSSDEHRFILDAGAYDVSSRLLEDRLTVDDGWVVRKNPGVIVKIVGREVLGSGVFSDDAAEKLSGKLAGREGWRGIDAVRQNRLVLMSEELFEAPYLQTGAMLLLAKTASPEVFGDVDAGEALKQLIEEATGAAAAGIYFYVYDGGN